MIERDLIPVSYERHGKLYWRRFTSFDFVRDLTECRIVSLEAQDIAAEFPFVFREREGFVEPVALLSLSTEMQTPFVTSEGQWGRRYVPTAFRCHPFQAGSEKNDPGGARQSILLIDESTGLISENPVGEPFFSAIGELASELGLVLEFLKARQTAEILTRDQCRELLKAGLLSPLTSHDGIPLPDSLLGVDENRLETLPKQQAFDLASCGALRLLYAHQVSLAHCTHVYCAQLRANGSVSASKQALSSQMNGFIAAMAADAALVNAGYGD